MAGPVPADVPDPLRPRLVIVSGAPAAGKTTLGRRLAPALGLARLSKDELREVIGDWCPPETHAQADALGLAAYALCYLLAGEFLDNGVGVLVEAAFGRGVAETGGALLPGTGLRPLAARARSVLVHLAAPLELSQRRFRERYARGERHPAHRDVDTVAAPPDALFAAAWPRWAQPLDLDVPTLVVDTTAGYVDDLSAILAFVRAAWDPIPTAAQRGYQVG